MQEQVNTTLLRIVASVCCSSVCMDTFTLTLSTDPQVAMAYTPAEKFHYVPYSMKQQSLIDNLPSGNYDDVDKPKPKPQPKPRKNYQTTELITSPATSDPQPPASVPKKPANLSSVSPGKAPPPLPSAADIPLSASGTVDVKAVVKKLSSQTLPRKETAVSEQATPQKSRRKSDNDIQPLTKGNAPPTLPKRIDKCFVKHTSLDSEPHKRVQTVSSQAVPPTLDELNWHPTGESMTLSQLASTHSSRFPLRIHLLDGYYGQTTHFTLSSSDIFDIHFTKHTQVVSVRDSMGVDYSVPLNSAIQFGIIRKQKPTDQPPQMMFSTVQDLLSLDPLPEVVCATSKWDSPSAKPQTTVEENELLLVKGIYKSPLRSKRSLKCYSLNTESKKLLPEECEGNFSVSPDCTKLHVYEFAVKFKALLPCKAMMFLCAETSYDSPVFHSVPKSLFKKPINVVCVTSEVSLTATTVTGKPSPTLDPKINHIDFDRNPMKSALPLEIPLDSHLGDIDVEILKAPNSAETEKLYINTQELLENANKTPYMILLDKGSDRINDTQSLFYMQVRPEKSQLGVAYETSSAVYERMDTASTTTATPTPSKRTSAATRKPAKVLVDIVEDNESDSSDEHTYEMLDEDDFRNYRSPAVQQLAPTSPPHHSLSPDNPFSPLQQRTPTPMADLAHTNQYAVPSDPSTIPDQSPHSAPSPYSYVHMIPPASVPRDVSKQVSLETKATNRKFLKGMSISKVSGLLCQLLWAVQAFPYCFPV